MKIRVRMDLIFNVENEDKANLIWDYVNQKRSVFQKIVNGEMVEKSMILIERCYHDEDPFKPCEIIKKWETE